MHKCYTKQKEEKILPEPKNYGHKLMRAYKLIRSF